MSRFPAAHIAFPHARACLAAAVVAALGAAPVGPPASAQELTRTAAGADTRLQSRDAALLAALGLDLATVEQTADSALLWRAVRALVLPSKVSEATQQRILRRAWLADPDIRHGSYLDSPNH
jgi:hypothetical protein